MTTARNPKTVLIKRALINVLHSFSLLAALIVATPVQGSPEYIVTEKPAPADVEDDKSSMEEAFKPTIARQFRTVGETFREGDLKLHLRNYYFDRAREDDDDSRAWAQGGWLGYETAWWKDKLRLSARVFTSQKLYGPDSKDRSRLLKEGQKSFTVLGEAYLEAQPLKDVSVKLYRQPLNLPYMNADDSRMVPVTFQGITLLDASHSDLLYGFGHITQIKKRDSDRFVSMTEAAGIEGHNRDVSVAGFRYDFTDGSNIGVVNQYGWDFMNTFYAEGSTRLRLTEDWGLLLSAQYTDQRSVGDELDGDFDTHTWGIKTETSILGMIARLAYTSTANNAGIQSPWGGKPSYISIMIEDFDRAGEDAWLVGLSSDFSIFGDNNFSGFINYAKGNTPDSGSNASPDQSEFDVTLDYRCKGGWMDGLWIRLRSAFRSRDDNNDARDLRAIVNYEIPIF
jgi:hypothetical protein